MQIPKFTRNHWISILCLVGIGIALFAFCFSNYSTSQSPVQHIAIMPSITQTPAVSNTTINMNTSNTSKFVSPTPYIAPYKVIPRNATYTPSKPLMAPIDPNRTYFVNINPSSDPSAGIDRGTVFEMSGTTDLPVGSELLVDVATVNGGPTTMTWTQVPIDRIYDSKPKQPPRITMTGTIYVEPPLRVSHSSNLTFNTWRFIIDSHMLLPDVYLVSVRSMSKSKDISIPIFVIGTIDSEDFE